MSRFEKRGLSVATKLSRTGIRGIRWGVEAGLFDLGGSHSQEGGILKGIVLNRWAVVW